MNMIFNSTIMCFVQPWKENVAILSTPHLINLVDGTPYF